MKQNSGQREAPNATKKRTPRSGARCKGYLLRSVRCFASLTALLHFASAPLGLLPHGCLSRSARLSGATDNTHTINDGED